MIRKRKTLLTLFTFSILSLFFLTSCSNLPLIGKKKEDKEKTENVPAGKSITVEGMEKVKGINPPKPETPPSRKAPVQPAPQKKESDLKTVSAPARPFFGSSLPFFQAGFKRKVAILDFENMTTYKDEKIGDAVAKKLSDKLEATQRVITVDRVVLTETLNRNGFRFESLTDPKVMKHAYKSLGIQAFALGTVTDVSLLASKGSETSDEEVSFATAKIEVRLVDASTGNLLRTFIGRSPIFGTKESGEYSKSKAVLKAIDFGLEDILDGFIRQLDFLEWTSTIARIEGENFYVNAGKLSGLRIGDTLEIFEPGKEVIHPGTNVSMGWTTGRLKGIIRITDLFGVDAAIGKPVQGQGFDPNDVVKSTVK